MRNHWPRMTCINLSNFAFLDLESNFEIFTKFASVYNNNIIIISILFSRRSLLFYK